MIYFPEHLKDIRVSNNVTQKQVADSIGVNIRNYQRYEAGDIYPTFHALIKLANYFDVSLDYLVGLSDNPKRN